MERNTPAGTGSRHGNLSGTRTGLGSTAFIVLELETVPEDMPDVALMGSSGPAGISTEHLHKIPPGELEIIRENVRRHAGVHIDLHQILPADTPIVPSLPPPEKFLPEGIMDLEKTIILAAYIDRPRIEGGLFLGHGHEKIKGKSTLAGGPDQGMTDRKGHRKRLCGTAETLHISDKGEEGWTR